MVKVDDTLEPGLEEEKRGSRDENWCRKTPVCINRGPGLMDALSWLGASPSTLCLSPSLRPEMVTGWLEVRTDDPLGLLSLIFTRSLMFLFERKEIHHQRVWFGLVVIMKSMINIISFLNSGKQHIQFTISAIYKYIVQGVNYIHIVRKQISRTFSIL